jgi:hypothetical protein
VADLHQRLIEVWDRQAADGFLLSSPEDIEVRIGFDGESQVAFRFVWLPHRELRHDLAELERRGILDPSRDEASLYREPRDDGRHCFLCPANIRVAHPRQVLVGLEMAGRPFVAGVNFAWSAPHHFTVMTAEHTDQDYGPETLVEMVELQAKTGLRVTWHGAGVGATIGWHFHYQVTSQEFPIERPGDKATYPIPVRRFTEIGPAHDMAAAWGARDPLNHDLNLLVAGDGTIFVIPRDRRCSHAANKGLMGAFESAGYFVYSEPGMREPFETADAGTARSALRQIRPEARID